MIVDVVVVGARCAGAPLATHLARAGLSVCVLDQARLPSDTASTHIVQPRGTAVLERLGVLAELRAAGAASISGVAIRYDDAALDVDYTDPAAARVLSTGATPGTCLRRHGFDAALLRAAERAGAEVRTRTAVRSLLRDRTGRVAGVQTDAGPIAARLVVGADGRRSTVADLVGARAYATYPAPRLAAWVYVADAVPARDRAAHRLRIGRFGRTAIIATPAGEGLLLAGVVPSVSEREEFLADREAGFERRLRDWPELHDAVAGRERVGPMRVVPDWQGYVRESAGRGWVLTGDAGTFKDPAAAQGITDALRQAESLASSLVAALPLGDAAVDVATHAWWRWRDADCRGMHWFARDLGAAGPTTPVLTETVRGLADEPWLFAAVLNRDVPVGAVRTPARVARAAGQAVRRRPAALPAIGAEAVRAVAGGARNAAGAVRGRSLRAQAGRRSSRNSACASTSSRPSESVIVPTV